MQARRGGRLAAAVGACAAGVLLTGAAARVAMPDAASEACELSRVTERDRTPSQRCLACHDGSTGRGSLLGVDRRGPGADGNHPVDMDYESVALRSSDRYVPASLLPPLVPLVDGRVACTSCHDGASRFAKHVVDPERLCYACHRL